MKQPWAIAITMFTVVSPSLAGAESSLELADLPGYRAALSGQSKQAPINVSFRDLWYRGQDYDGKRVRVEGRLARRFHQEPIGSFPALTEAWLVAPSGDPFCVVFPESDRAKLPKVGLLRFTGTYLKKVRYQGSDGPRGAPLIVGDQPPAIVHPGEPSPTPQVRFSRLDWLIGLGAALVVMLVLLSQHARRPRRRLLPQRREDALHFSSPSDPVATNEEDQSGSKADAERLGEA